jgi:hypothetical protein
MTEKPAEHLADSIEHDEEMLNKPRSTFTPDHGTEVQSRERFQWDYDVITNIMALFTCFFASTWMLVVPSGTIGFISEAFPLEYSRSPSRFQRLLPFPIAYCSHSSATYLTTLAAKVFS